MFLILFVRFDLVWIFWGAGGLRTRFLLRSGIIERLYLEVYHITEWTFSSGPQL